MACIQAPVPSVPDLPTGIGIEAPLPVLPSFDATFCCKLFSIPIPPLPPFLALAVPIPIMIAINETKDQVLDVLRQLAFECPRE